MNLDFVKKVVTMVSEASYNRNLDFFCMTRDVFQARLDSFVLQTNKYLESAVIGEIGNNTFDHNWQFPDGETRGAHILIQILRGT